MTAPRRLNTVRLLLRSFEPEDVPALVRIFGPKEIAATTRGIPHPYTEADAVNFLGKANEEFSARRSVRFAIATSAGNELCGSIGLHLDETNKRAELGYAIGVPYWGRGYATEAARAVVAFGFEILGLHRIFAHHFAGNKASRRVLEKIGMKNEGRSREHICKWGQFVDVENYGLLAQDFSRGQ